MRRALISGLIAVSVGLILVLVVKSQPGRKSANVSFASESTNLAVNANLNPPEVRKPVVVQSYDFDDPADIGGWELWGSKTENLMRIEKGVLHIYRDNRPRTSLHKKIDLEASEVNLIELQVRRPLRRFSVAWRTSSGQWSPDFIGSRVVSAEEWRTVSIPVGQSAYWRGRVGELKINFDTVGVVTEEVFQVDSIRLLRDENPAFIKRPKRLGYVIADELQWVIPTAVPGRFVKGVEIPKNARLSFSCGLSKETWQSHSGEIVLQVAAITDEGASHPLAAVPLQPKAQRASWRWTKEAVDLKSLAGRRATLVFETTSSEEKPGGLVLLGNPTIEPAAPQPGKERPNIIVILVDALRPDHLGTYGYARPTSPNLDKLAKDSIVFENAFAQAHSTHVSVASLFTSLFPLESKDKATGYYTLKDDVITLGERLEAAGYANAAFSTNFLVHWDYGFDRGFETFYCHEKLAGEQLTQKTIGWLRDNTRRPFFVYLHFMDVHSPYTPPKKFRFQFRDSDYKPTNSVLLGGNAVLVRQEMEKGHIFSPADREYWKSLYDGEIAYTDASIGRMLEWLRRNEMYDNTIIVILADHGEEFWEHGSLEHGDQFYDELLRVPLIVKLPKKAKRKEERVSATVSLVDVYPTLLELAGVPAREGLRGESLLNVDPSDNRGAYAEVSRTRALRKDGWKLIDKPGREQDELYELYEDPAETRNVIAKYPEVAEELLAAMDLLKQKKENDLSAEEERDKLDPKTLERLRSLGYID